ncbi:hypothetical protein B0H11DRAFT_2245000 [Mycena galericulata]|nr:hypothetical protein B0H11DRAFT_2245000 [Mycena galericulata]
MSPIGLAAQEVALDIWWPRRPVLSRRGRSATSYTFPRDAYGTVFRSRNPYSFVDVLTHQNQLVIHREDTNPVYRGDVNPAALFMCRAAPETRFSCAGPPPKALPDLSDDDFSDNGAQHSASATPAPEDGTHAERLSSPVTPFQSGSGSKPLVKVTYLSRDKNRLRDPAQLGQQTKLAADAKRTAAKAAAAARRIARDQQHPGSRSSRRLRRGRVGDSSDHGVWTAEQALRAGYLVHAPMNEYVAFCCLT